MYSKQTHYEYIHTLTHCALKIDETLGPNTISVKNIFLNIYNWNVTLPPVLETGRV